MSYRNTQMSLATTAIAAVLALSATQVSAQETPPPTEPITQTSPDATTTTPTVDPLAAEPAAPETSTAPAATDSTSDTIVASDVTPATKRTHTATTHKTATSHATAPSAPVHAPVKVAQAAPAIAAPMAAPAPVAAAPVAIDPQPAAATQPAADRRNETNELLSGGAGVLILLGLAGGAVALQRRRRREEDAYAEDEVISDEQPIAEPEPVMADEPAAAEPEPVVVEPRADWEPAMMPLAAAMAFSKPEPKHDPIEGAPTTALPEGFDLSRFGPHVQAAYRGPTEDNPSLSLKHRLRKASAMDQRARMEAEARAGQREAAPVESDRSFMLGKDEGEATAPREYDQA